MKWILCVCMLVTQSCPTLCDPMDCSPPGSSVHGIHHVRILEWVAMPFSRGSSPTKGSNLCLLHCRRIPYHLIHQGKSKILHILLQIVGAWLFPNLKFKSDNNKITKLPEMQLELWSFQLRGRTRTESPDMTCSVPCNCVLVSVWFCSAHYRKVKLPYTFLQIPREVAKGKRWSPGSKQGSESRSVVSVCDPMDCIHGILQARILEWVAFPFRIFPTQRLNPGLPHCRGIFYQLSHKGSPRRHAIWFWVEKRLSCFVFVFVFLTAPCNMWDLNSQTKNQTRTPCTGSLNHSTALGKSQEKIFWWALKDLFWINSAPQPDLTCVCFPAHGFWFPPADLPCKPARVTCVSAPCTILLLFHLSYLLFAWKF